MKSNKKPVLLLGLGGHAKVLINILRLCGREIKGALSVDSLGAKIMDVEVIGGDNDLSCFNNKDYELVNALGQLPNNKSRENLFKMAQNHGFKFSRVIHPSAIIASDVVLGEGAQVMAGSIIEPAVDIGDNSIINTGANINHDTKIGQHSHIAPGVVICGGANIGSSVFIGSSVSVMPGARIKDATFVKAGRIIKEDKLGLLVE